jgi:excisionase family DNA binding protein
MTTPHPAPTPAGSVLDGDPRILIPLPEAAERLGISRWQAYKLARSGRLPTTRLGARDLHVPAAVLRRIEQEGLPPEPEGAWSCEPLRSPRPPPTSAGSATRSSTSCWSSSPSPPTPPWSRSP